MFLVRFGLNFQIVWSVILDEFTPTILKLTILNTTVSGLITYQWC
jgi:hypothetical protein